jgi:WD40 repeat protein
MTSKRENIMRRTLLTLMLACLALPTAAQDTLIPLPYEVGTVMALAPDGVTLAVAQQGVAVDHAVRASLLPITLLDLASGETLDTLSGHTDYATDLAFTPDGTQLVSLHGNGDLIVWDVAGGSRVREYATGFFPGSFDLTSDGEAAVILAYNRPGQFMRWMLESGDITAVVGPHFETFAAFRDNFTQFPAMMDVSFAAFDVSPDGAAIAASTQNDAVIVWDIASGEPTTLRTASEQKGRLGIRSLTYAPDGARVYATFNDGDAPAILGWNTASGEEVVNIPTEGQAAVVSVSPDGQRLAWAELLLEADTTALYVVTVDDWTPVKVADFPLRVFATPTTLLAFTPDGSQIVVGNLLDAEVVPHVAVVAVPQS